MMNFIGMIESVLKHQTTRCLQLGPIDGMSVSSIDDMFKSAESFCGLKRNLWDFQDILLFVIILFWNHRLVKATHK